MVRVLTPDQIAINTLLQSGAFIYRRRYRVEPSRTQPPLPLRCEKCQQYNNHSTERCPNDPKCGYCAENHQTKACPNQSNPPKCSQCNSPHPTFSYKCQGRPKPDEDPDNFMAVPLRLPPVTQPQPHPPALPPPTIDQIIQFLSLTFQNLYPHNRPAVLHQITLAAREVFQVHLKATYSGPYVFFSVAPTSPE